MATKVDEITADLEEVLRQGATGKIHPDLLKRVRQRSERVQEELRKKYGQLNVAVDLIREVREE